MPKKKNSPEPDPIPDEIKHSLGLAPFGSNLIIKRSDLTALQSMFVELHKVPVPIDVFRVLMRYHDKVREMVGLCSLEELSDHWAEKRGEEARYEAQQYICNCSRKQRAKRTKKDDESSSS